MRRGGAPAPIEPCHALVHGEGSTEGALGIVLMRYWRAKHGHAGIPDKLLDLTLVVLNYRGHSLEQIALERPHLLGIERSLNAVKPERSANSTVWSSISLC